MKRNVLLSSGLQGLLRMKVLPRLRYILEVVRPSPPVVQDILEILTRVCRHSSSSATQVATQTAKLHPHTQSQDLLRFLCHASWFTGLPSSDRLCHAGAGLSPSDGGVAVRVPSHFLGCVYLNSASVRLRTPAGRRHEAAEGRGYLRQTRLRQTGERCRTLSVQMHDKWGLFSPFICGSKRHPQAIQCDTVAFRLHHCAI